MIRMENKNFNNGFLYNTSNKDYGVLCTGKINTTSEDALYGKKNHGSGVIYSPLQAE